MRPQDFPDWVDSHIMDLRTTFWLASLQLACGQSPWHLLEYAFDLMPIGISTWGWIELPTGESLAT